MSRRHKAREVVLQMLYLKDLNPDVGFEQIRTMVQTDLPDETLSRFAWGLFSGTMEFRPQLDKKIEEAAVNWSLSRMAPTDRNVLRLGAYELLQTDTPHRVVIDEALELAKSFGGANSGSFVNGILDRLLPPEKRNRAVQKPVEDEETTATFVSAVETAGASSVADVEIND
jgi:N utilization substance protein B